ncbi:GntR family transcriptional regulator [Streptomyces sp. NPDC052043]|uniref:GntR family transcriptional regulator n=1 Tax=Streptomyces sp. NPDC052043 TaxID=3365684 RepID=UPI0037CF8F6D
MAVRQPTLRGVPRKSALGSYIYVLRFNVGIVKVGFTASPGRRMSDYRSTLSPFGISITDYWVSEPHGQAEDNEALLLTFCRARAAQANKSEYFKGIDYGEVVAFAGTLPYVPLQAEPSAPAHSPIDLLKYEQIATVFAARITRGIYPPRRRIPTEAGICDEFGVSRPTARAAVQLLVERGLIQTVRGKGSYVVDSPPQA